MNAFTLQPGTPCFLTGSGHTNPDLIGRVVEVVAGPREEFGGGPGPYYEVQADWLSRRFPRNEVFIVHRRNLKRITPPPLGPLAAATEKALAIAAELERTRPTSREAA